MPGNDIHEIAMSDPENGFEGEELGTGLFEEGSIVFAGTEIAHLNAGLLILKEPPQGATLSRSYGAAGPGCVCRE